MERLAPCTYVETTRWDPKAGRSQSFNGLNAERVEDHVYGLAANGFWLNRWRSSAIVTGQLADTGT